MNVSILLLELDKLDYLAMAERLIPARPTLDRMLDEWKDWGEREIIDRIANGYQNELRAIPEDSVQQEQRPKSCTSCCKGESSDMPPTSEWG